MHVEDCEETLTDLCVRFQVAICLQGLETVSCPEHPCLSPAFNLHDHDILY